jgi:hypothetical protein
VKELSVKAVELAADCDDIDPAPPLALNDTVNKVVTELAAEEVPLPELLMALNLMS